LEGGVVGNEDGNIGETIYGVHQVCSF